MNRAILFGGLFAIITALTQVACAQSKGEIVELIPVEVTYTLRGQSHMELYHDAMAVCVDGEQSCDVYLEDHQAVEAWALTLEACLTRAVVWSARLDEPATVLGCENAAAPRVLVVDRGAL